MYIFGPPERGFWCKKSFHVEKRHIGQNGLGVLISATPNYINWFQPLQMKKEKEMHIFGPPERD